MNKNYVVKSVHAERNQVVVEDEEHVGPEMTWIGEEPISFFYKSFRYVRETILI